MKKLLLAGMLILALCLPASASGGGSASQSEAAVTQKAAAPETGGCYRLSGCRDAYLMEYLGKVTQTQCWQHGGDSWLAAAAQECVPNPDPE